jgi:hypothetical protein
MDVKYFELSEAEAITIVQICPEGEYRILPPDSISLPISQALISKCDSVLIACSGVEQTNTAYFVCILNRVDRNDSAIDQEPFGFLSISGDIAASGCIIHHGNWVGRTIHYPDNEINDILKKLGSVTKLQNFPQDESGQALRAGKLQYLDSSGSIYKAFEKMVDVLDNLRRQIVSGKTSGNNGE